MPLLAPRARQQTATNPSPEGEEEATRQGGGHLETSIAGALIKLSKMKGLPPSDRLRGDCSNH